MLGPNTTQKDLTNTTIKQHVYDEITTLNFTLKFFSVMSKKTLKLRHPSTLK